LSLVATAGLIAFFPVSAAVDDLLVRTVLAKYVLTLAIGTVCCDRKIWWILSAPVAVAALGVAMYFFANPIQTPLGMDE
jgi:hypothetical protein